MRRLRLALAAAVLVAGCSGDGQRDDTAARPSTTATQASSTTTSTSTTTTTLAPGVAAVGPQAATPQCPAVPARPAPRPDRPRYVLQVDVRPAERLVTGRSTVRFVPDLATDRLVFRLWPNGPRSAAAGARLEVTELRIGRSVITPEQPDPTTLVVPLGGTLDAGQLIEVDTAWRLSLPQDVADRVSQSGEAVRLGSFYPVLAWEPGAGWATEPATSAFAETSSAPAADVLAAVSVPEGLTAMATGEPDGHGRWSATAVREFALSVGRFRLAEATAAGPHPVRVTVGVHDGIPEAPEAYLGRVVASLEDLARRYGPYPWPSYSLAITPALKGGIEYPMHVMQGPGSAGRTTPHEVAHQWFYALVGNNQGRDPWLDEGLATFAEARVEGTLGEMVAKTVPAAGRNRLGEPMRFWEAHKPAYYRSVYVQGAQALAALGPPELVDCALRHYVAVNAWQLARPGDLLASLRLVFPDAGEVLARYGVRP